jgi:hypothetical protein
MTIDDVRSSPRVLLLDADLWTYENHVRQPKLDGIDPWVDPTPNRQVVGEWIVWKVGPHIDRVTGEVARLVQPSSILRSLWTAPKTLQGVHRLIGEVGNPGLCPCGRVWTDGHKQGFGCRVPDVVATAAGARPGAITGVRLHDVVRWCRRVRAILTLAAHVRVALTGPRRQPDAPIPFYAEKLSFVRLRREADVADRWHDVVPTKEVFIDDEVVTIVGEPVAPDGAAPPPLQQWFDVADIVDDWLRVTGIRYGVDFRHHEVQGTSTDDQHLANIARRGRLAPRITRPRTALSLAALSLARLLGEPMRTVATCVHCGRAFEPRHKTSTTAPVCHDDQCRRARARDAARRSRQGRVQPASKARKRGGAPS